MFGLAAFAALVALIPFVKEGYGVEEAISDAAKGSYGYLQTIAFFALGLGSLALAWGLWQVLEGKAARIGIVLVGAGWGVASIVAGIFPADPGDDAQTTAGTIHIAASLLGDVCGIIGLLVLSVGFRKRSQWRSLWPASALLWTAALIAFMVTAAAQDADWWGIPQRVYVGLVLGWLLLAAGRLRTVARAA